MAMTFISLKVFFYVTSGLKFCWIYMYIRNMFLKLWVIDCEYIVEASIDIVKHVYKVKSFRCEVEILNPSQNNIQINPLSVEHSLCP